MRETRRTGVKSAPRRGKAVATIRDVASRAGVSVATVSRAINGIGPVSIETSRRIQTAVRALRYVPHAAARSLSMRRSHTLCVVLPEVHGEFFSEVIRAIDVATRQHGYHLLVSGSHNDADEMAAVLRALRGRVDGIIVMSPETSAAAFSKEFAAATPVVFLNSDAGRRNIRIDNYTGARAMTDHLITLGHERIAFVAGPEGNVDATERQRGYRDALAAAKTPKRRPIEIAGDFTEDAGYAAVPKILSMSPRPTALFAANDAMAIGAMHALREAGVELPREMAVAGFDDVPIARYVTPQLTTVRVDIAELGRRAVESLIAAIDGNAQRRGAADLITTTLIVRQSCGSPERRKVKAVS